MEIKSHFVSQAAGQVRPQNVNSVYAPHEDFKKQFRLIVVCFP